MLWTVNGHFQLINSMLESLHGMSVSQTVVMPLMRLANLSLWRAQSLPCPTHCRKHAFPPGKHGRKTSTVQQCPAISASGPSELFDSIQISDLMWRMEVWRHPMDHTKSAGNQTAFGSFAKREGSKFIHVSAGDGRREEKTLSHPLVHSSDACNSMMPGVGNSSQASSNGAGT